MTDHEVVIAGGGPTGLMLGAELTLAGVDVAVVERRANQELAGSRAGGLHSRTIEVFDMRGIADRFLSQGQTAQIVGFNLVRLDMSDFPSRHPYGLALFQNRIEMILADWVAELRVRIYREREVTGFTQDDTGVDVAVSDGNSMRAQYLVGCDGARSIVRKTAAIDFPGSDATTSWMIAEVETKEEPAFGLRQDARGLTHAIGKGDRGHARMVLVDREVNSDEPTLADLSEALTEIYGTDFGVHDPIWLSRFTDMTRQAATYRKGRVLLAGDAAHVHPPIGGQGLNIGVQDAVNLGWKLAQVVKGISPETLLDTYQAERHPVAARVLKNTMAQSALRRPDDHTKALGDFIAEFLSVDELRKRMAGEMSGLAVHYGLGEGHPLLGRRMPDLEVATESARVRVYSLLHDPRALLLNLGERGGIDITPWSDRVQLIEAQYDGPWELPVLGVVTAPSAVLIRPDGYAAWVGEGTEAGMVDALTTWFGSPTK
ncbi:MAG TPA: FAD-dependent monooxygenase [Gemmatimonadaceae bacterium]|nr:FAD-dependent monooxygenase [Gemmatimonadaceae bacterium]